MIKNTLLGEFKSLVYKYEDGGSKYFSIPHFLRSSNFETFQHVYPDLSDEQASWLNSLGQRLDDTDVYELGVGRAQDASKTYATKSSLVGELIDANKNQEWEDETKLYLDSFIDNSVPYVPLFAYHQTMDTDSRPIASENGWIEANATELGLSCKNFRAAESILHDMWKSLDPFETPFRYVVPEPEIPVLVRNLISLIDCTERQEQISAYRSLKILGRERERIQDAHTRERSSDD